MRTETHRIKNRYSTHGIHRNIPVYEMNTVNCSASPMEGYKGTEVTLIDNVAWNEKFSAWALTGATATGNNIVLNNDVTAQGIYETAKNITYGTRTSGNKVSGFISDQVTITGTPAWNEKTSSYSVTGATLTGNKFTLTGSNVTAKANFETAKNVTRQTDGHGTIAANKVSGFIGDQVVLSNTANNDYEFSEYTITGANLTGNKFNFIGNDVTAKAWFNYVSPTKNARIALRFYDLPNSFTSGGKTFYPFAIQQRLGVTSYTGDNIDSLMTTIFAGAAIYYAYPLWSNGDTYNIGKSYSANSINFNKVDNVHLYANTGTTAGCYEIRGRCNANNEIIALYQHEYSASDWGTHVVNPRNIKDSNNLWIYGRGQGIMQDYNVAGSALSAALNNENIPVEVQYWNNSTAMCAPNSIVQHSDIIADITWTE